MKTYHKGTQDWSCYIEPNGKGFDVSWVYGNSFMASPAKYYSWEDLDEVLMLRGINDVDFASLGKMSQWQSDTTTRVFSAPTVTLPKKCCGNCETTPMSKEELAEKKKLKEEFMEGIAEGYNIDKTDPPQDNSTITAKLSDIDIKLNGTNVIWNGQRWVHTKVESVAEEKPMEFQKGDVVSFGGRMGIVESTDTHDHYPLNVRYSDSGGLDFFTLDGKYDTKHTEPLLKFVSRPKEKVKKTYYMGVGVITNPLHSSSLCTHKEDLLGWDQIIEVQIYVEE